jgi:UTP:GlnB (protein PII) uridylyltransferase
MPKNSQSVPLAEQLPSDYVNKTTSDERDAHQKLYNSFSSSRGIAISFEQRLHQTTLLHLIFEDCIGSLGVICAALTARKINICQVQAFTTKDGVAIDSFEVSSFDSDAEASLRATMEQKLVKSGEDGSNLIGQLPDSYLQATNPAERAAHSRMHAAWLASGAIGVQLEQTSVADGKVHDVLLHLVFRDVEGSLAVITSALASCGINIKRVACFSTSQTPSVAIDTFQLDVLEPEAEAMLLAQLLEHLSEIEGDSLHGGSRWLEGS